jgi:hypothetical protein
VKMDKQRENDLLRLLPDEAWEAIFKGDRIEAIKQIRNAPRSPFGLKESIHLADELIEHFKPKYAGAWQRR